MKKIFLLSVMVLALLLSACAPKEEAAGKSMFFIAKVAGIPYFEQNSYPGAQEAADELGYELIINSPDTPDAAKQIELIESAMAQGVSAILVSADDYEALCPTLNAAMDDGIVVVSWDSDTACRQLFQNQASTEMIGRINVMMMCDILGGPDVCEGQVAILSAAATMTNQNSWIEWMMEEWKDPKYSKMEFVGTVYGDDVDQKSYDEALGLFKSYPDLVGIISPTSVGVAASARAVEDEGLQDQIKVTGLGLPNELRAYVKSGTMPQFALWVPLDQAYLSIFMAHALLTGEIKGEEGETFDGGRLGTFTVGADGEVLLGDPQVFDADNIDDFDF
ncbi:MAG TPA: rhamnose ABC transporter substrate-binding protein [Anaerolineae bacterium]|nr:rhamnose ABC transporter substrate-binding protein [Anaerolineae bacterium]